jgi:hypothetical protein
MVELSTTMPNKLGLDCSEENIERAEKRLDAYRVQLHVTTLGILELEHLLAMLNANVENLPTIVVKAMTALAESVGVEPQKHEVTVVPAETIIGADGVIGNWPRHSGIY